MIKKILLSILLISQLFSSENFVVTFNEDDELQVSKYASNSNDLLVILPSEHGLTQGLKALAKNLNTKNTEVWIADPYSSWFLPTVASSLKKIPINSYKELIKKAVNTNKNVYLFSNDKASSILLKALNSWQQSTHKKIAGVILLSPNLYNKTPQAGDEGKLNKKGQIELTL